MSNSENNNEFNKSAKHYSIDSFVTNAWGIITNHSEISAIILLILASFALIFFGLGNYPLIDVDETRYAVIARDMVINGNWNDILLNGEPFLEKPPLYFWMVAASVKLFNNFNPYIVRLPIALSAVFLTFFTYFLGKKVSGIKFGLLSALVLLSSVFYLIFAHVAILDMVLTVCIGATLYCGFLATISEGKTKSAFWAGFYVFTALGFLAKGILAIAFPIIIMFIYCLLTKSLKQVFRPINIFPGIILFLLITIPWHIAMYDHYGYSFFQEYYIKHHFARFINSAEIGRKQPIWFFIPIFIAGFMPWIVTFIAILIKGAKKYISILKSTEGKISDKLIKPLTPENDLQRLILFSLVYFMTMFIVLSISSTKLPTYILPVFPAAAILTGFFWFNSDKYKQNWKIISFSTELISGILILAAIGAVFAYWFMPFEIKIRLEVYRDITIYGLLFISIFMLMRLKYKKTLDIFACYIVFMIFVMLVAKSFIFNTLYSFGQNELIKYATFAQAHKTELVAFDFAVKPSMLTVYDKKINYIPNPEFEKLDEVINKTKTPTVVIVKNKNMQDYSDKINKRFILLINGEKYSLYSTKNITNLINKQMKTDDSILLY